MFFFDIKDYFFDIKDCFCDIKDCFFGISVIISLQGGHNGGRICDKINSAFSPRNLVILSAIYTTSC